MHLRSWHARALAGLAPIAPASAETLEVGAYPANPPWENKKEDGSFEGFEVDLVNEIGKRIGAEMHIQDLGFQALFAATSSGRIDLAISSITITNERLGASPSRKATTTATWRSPPRRIPALRASRT